MLSLNFESYSSQAFLIFAFVLYERMMGSLVGVGVSSLKSLSPLSLWLSLWLDDLFIFCGILSVFSNIPSSFWEWDRRGFSTAPFFPSMETKLFSQVTNLWLELRVDFVLISLMVTLSDKDEFLITLWRENELIHCKLSQLEELIWVYAGTC